MTLKSKLSRRDLLGAAALTAMTPATAFASDPEAVADVVGGGRRWDADIGLMAEKTGGIGYHTRYGKGIWVHPTRSNMDYALRLLDASHNAATCERAEGVIGKVIALQDTDPNSRWYGVWSWYVEEPLDRMSPPDPNWADFIGARISEILLVHGHVLSGDLKDRMRAALRHACNSIVQRAVGPAYTNIAMMAGRVTAAGGEILGDPALLNYGRDHLAGLLAYTRDQGSFNEYNSPTYTIVGLEELEGVLRFVKDRPSRDSAEALRQIAWDLIAAHYHPASHEWAGPHARAYEDRMPKDVRAKLSARVGLSLSATPGPVPRLSGAALPCPSRLKGRFQSLPSAEFFERTRFIKGADDSQSVYGTTWMVEGACLGSANAESFWTQRHPVIGFWPAGDGSAVFRVRCQKDGRDFASFGIRTVQDHGRVLIGVHPIGGAGDWHNTLDRTSDGVYPGKELRVRFLVDGKGAEIRPAGEGVYELACAGWKAVVATGPSVFDGREDGGRWEISREGDTVSIDYVAPLNGQIAPERLATTLVTAAVTLTALATPAHLARPRVEGLVAGGRRLDWQGLGLFAPDRAPPPVQRVS